MKIYLFGLFAFCISCSTEDNLLFEYVDPLQKVFPESAYFPSLKANASAARGENVSFQFAVRADNTIEDLNIEVVSPMNGNTILNEVKTGFVDFVKLGRKNPVPSHDSFNSISGFYPDPIIYDDARNIPGAQTQPLWISVKVPTECKPGIYKGKVKISGKIKGDKFLKAHDIEIEVFKPIIEKTSLSVTNWIHLDRLEYLNNNQNVEKYSDLYWELISEFARTLSSYRQNVIMLSPFEYTEFTFESNKWEFDFSNFNEMVSIFKNEGVIGRLEGGHFGSRLFGGWADPFGLFVPVLDSDSITKELLPLNNPKTQKFYQAFLPAFYKNIELNGWEDQYIQHIADEPIDANVESYIEISKFIKSIVPEIKIVEACHTNQLSGMIDIWVPQLNYLNEDLDFYLERKVKNDEVWFYTCLGPTGEYANRFIELPLIKTRLLHWINAKYNITGYLHWGFNYWGGGPDISASADPFSDAAGIITSSGNVLPGGDCFISYPGYKTIYPSIRLEAMRDGIVDYELLKMYKQKFPENAKDMINTIVYGFKHYDTDISSFRQKRRKMLKELSE